MIREGDFRSFTMCVEVYKAKRFHLRGSFACDKKGHTGFRVLMSACRLPAERFGSPTPRDR